MKFTRDQVMTGFFIVLYSGFAILGVYALNDTRNDELARRAKLRQDQHQCIALGGIWTPVGGSRDGQTIRGCVFPPVRP